jgi:NAD(P)-dependent dehydrogenase (short-subunit alcohol dehydrogenase family)
MVPNFPHVFINLGQSKLAMILYSQELASRLEGKPMFVNSLHPGDVDTGASPYSSC